MASPVAQIPAFCQMLVDMQIPEALQSGRYGITHYHNPQILADLNKHQPSERMLDIIDEFIFSDPARSSWNGTSEQLRRDIMAVAPTSGNLLLGKWDEATGVYIARLSKKYPNRIRDCGRVNGAPRTWEIKKPPG
jgi:hypothetical protein